MIKTQFSINDNKYQTYEQILRGIKNRREKVECLSFLVLNETEKNWMHVSPLQSREKWEFLEIKKRKKQKETERNRKKETYSETR